MMLNWKKMVLGHHARVFVSGASHERAKQVDARVLAGFLSVDAPGDLGLPPGLSRAYKIPAYSREGGQEIERWLQNDAAALLAFEDWLGELRGSGFQVVEVML